MADIDGGNGEDTNSTGAIPNYMGRQTLTIIRNNEGILGRKDITYYLNSYEYKRKNRNASVHVRIHKRLLFNSGWEQESIFKRFHELPGDVQKELEEEYVSWQRTKDFVQPIEYSGPTGNRPR